MSVKLIAIDPWDCGCTECITGEYKPLRYATAEDIADLIAGRLRSHLHMGDELIVEAKTTFASGNGEMTRLYDTVVVSYEQFSGLKNTWEIDPYQAGLAA